MERGQFEVAQGLHALGQHHRQHRLAVGEHMAKFAGTVVRVDRHDARAQRIEGEKMQQELRSVLEQQGHPMPGTVASTAIARRHSIDFRKRVGITQFKRLTG